LTFATVLGLEEADLEDVFDPDLYAKVLNQAFNLTGTNEATGQKLLDADTNTTRLVKKRKPISGCFHQRSRNLTTTPIRVAFHTS